MTTRLKAHERIRALYSRAELAEKEIATHNGGHLAAQASIALRKWFARIYDLGRQHGREYEREQQRGPR